MYTLHQLKAKYMKKIIKYIYKQIMEDKYFRPQFLFYAGYSLVSCDVERHSFQDVPWSQIFDSRSDSMVKLSFVRKSGTVPQVGNGQHTLCMDREN